MAHFANVVPAGLIAFQANLHRTTFGGYGGTLVINEMGGIMNLNPTVSPRQDSGDTSPLGPQRWPI
jgi:hypothetical protein